ncbi:RNA pyrophosphohydrolase [Litorimonas sp. RW-G-Af-16]|uniref:RNA pyrophosphohydrolase n=1 Tax=Litorimonas sp. RW-G-Af-16 TaxID=3241168 RepID=UPI00390CBC33
MADLSDYRPCVGIAVFNAKGKVWVGKRLGETGPYCWQMPQGGIDPNEAPEVAAIRELYEETGITLDMLTPLGEVEGWLTYDFPESHQKSKSQNWRGQKQRWFAFRFHGKKSKIDLKAHGPQEFSKWKWAKLTKLPSLIIPFKRDVYERLVVEFAPYAIPREVANNDHG